MNLSPRHGKKMLIPPRTCRRWQISPGVKNTSVFFENQVIHQLTNSFHATAAPAQPITPQRISVRYPNGILGLLGFLKLPSLTSLVVNGIPTFLRSSTIFPIVLSTRTPNFRRTPRNADLHVIARLWSLLSRNVDLSL